MKEEDSFLKNKIYFDSPNKNIVPLTTTFKNNESLLQIMVPPFMSWMKKLSGIPVGHIRRH